MRTVYQELNDFIKAKKTKRQIVIVSHNPNLVVSTDSENVIVANQEGQINLQLIRNADLSMLVVAWNVHTKMILKRYS